MRKKAAANPIKKGFFTALLNPKGMLIYFAILPQFIDQSANTVSQGLILSLIFIGLIFVVYCSLSLVFAKMTPKSGRSMHVNKNGLMRIRWFVGIGRNMADCAIKLSDEALRQKDACFKKQTSEWLIK